MKRAGKRILSFITKVLALVLAFLLLPYAVQFFRSLLPDLQGEIALQSRIIEQKQMSSKRLEVTTVEEEGVQESKTSVVILGAVGRTEIRYKYTASIGIDLSRVSLSAEEDRIVFALPPPEILNDGIEALSVKRHNFFSHAIDRSTEDLLEDQRKKCRESFLSGGEHDETIWEDTKKAFEETVCEWLASYGEHHYSFEFYQIKEDGSES